MARYIIIGGVAGGATAAARLRRLDENADIILVERGEFISFANCGLPYHIGDVIKDRGKLLVQTSAGMKKRFGIDVRTKSEVIKIEPAKKIIEINNLVTNEKYSEKYDKLVLSPGAEPIKPPIPGIKSEGIFTLRNIADMDAINNYINKNTPRSAVVIGGGFIGIEMAENLRLKNLDVSIIEMVNQVMNMTDYEIAAFIHQELKRNKVSLHLGDGVASFEKSEDGLLVKLNSGKEIKTDMVILSIGVKPEAKLAKDAGLKIGASGGIYVNEFLQTSDPDIYAVGDAIEFNNPILNKNVITYLAGPANKQARTAAANIVFGNNEKFHGAIASAVIKVFELTAATTGASEKALKQNSISYKTVTIHASSHAGYYPGAFPITVKVQFSPESGKILGAQIVGYDGVDKRIDVIAALMQKDGTITDMKNFEQAYAPPYSSAKDPVNITGCSAENVLKGLCNVITWDAMKDVDAQKDVLLDVRTAAENQMGSIKGSLNIPVDDLRGRLDEIPKGKKIIVYCAAGLRGYIAARILLQNGFKDVYNLTGGYKIYEVAVQN